jgi:spore coat protein JB
MRNKRHMLNEIRATEFACLELRLFLDTHPDDARAMEDYDICACRLRQLMDDYSCKYGPLLGNGLQPAGECRTWVKSPWPWEM